MTRRKRSDFAVTARKSPFELDLDTPQDGRSNYVTFRDPQKLPTKDAFELNQEEDPKKVLEILLGEDFPAFWAEWSTAPVDETNKLIEDVMTHYGADPNS